ncbi:hypothetical protein [Bartonella sp. CB74]|uniref:hypothetical protein n=1 Tax=Bartonella sp. CB74 TaxID=3113620 RepID=UPI002F96382E
MKDRNHDDAMAEIFQNDPETAVATLDAILADGDQGELLVTLRQIMKNPNKLTIETLKKSDDREDVYVAKDINDLFHDLGI